MNRTLNSNRFLNPVILQKETAENIGKSIKNSNLKVSQLQNLLGFESPQAIYNWMEGKTLPSLDNCVKLSCFLKKTMEELIVFEMRENLAYNEVPDAFKL